jgi:hypothetical protein
LSLKKYIGVKNIGCDYSHQVKEQNATCVFILIIVGRLREKSSFVCKNVPDGTFSIGGGW